MHTAPNRFVIAWLGKGRDHMWYRFEHIFISYCAFRRLIRSLEVDLSLGSFHPNPPNEGPLAAVNRDGDQRQRFVSRPDEPRFTQTALRVFWERGDSGG